jgi:hypothetical protein
MAQSKFPFPYATHKAAQADGFAKCAKVTGETGEEVADRICQAGWYQILQRGEQNAKMAGDRQIQKLALELASKDPKIKAELDAAVRKALGK